MTKERVKIKVNDEFSKMRTRLGIEDGKSGRGTAALQDASRGREAAGGELNHRDETAEAVQVFGYV